MNKEYYHIDTSGYDYSDDMQLTQEQKDLIEKAWEGLKPESIDTVDYQSNPWDVKC